MNFFRVPLNFLVVVVLVKVGGLANSTVFMLCCAWLLAAVGLQTVLTKYIVTPPNSNDLPTTTSSH